MKCDIDYFYDTTTLGCLPCKDSCHPNRVETKTECNTHCKEYLQRIEDSQVTKDPSRPSPSTHNNALNMALIITVLSAVIILLLIIAAALNTVRRLQPYRKGKTKQDYFPVTMSTSGARAFYEDSSKKEVSRNDHLSSHCQDRSASNPTLGKAVPLSIHSYISSTERLFFPSQETHFQDDCKPTAPKSIQTVDVEPSTAVKQPIQTVLSLDLQEDDGYDFVEQACALPPEGNNDTGDGVVIVENHISRPRDRRNYDITAPLQRLPWIRQFWWDTEGAKIVVDESHRKNGKELIKRILELEGIPSQDFSFEIVDPSNLLRGIQ